jgi:hypothetical protein
MNRLLTILLLAAATTAHGQVDNPPTTFPLPATFTTNVTINGILTAANIAFTNNYFTNPTTFSTNVTVNGTLIIASPTVPASPTSSGAAGQVAFTNNYFYICISNNTWRRVQLGTW